MSLLLWTALAWAGGFEPSSTLPRPGGTNQDQPVVVEPPDEPTPDLPGDEPAAEPEPEPEPQPTDAVDDDAVEVIQVWGEPAIRAARVKVVRGMQDEGWELRRRKEDGTYVFRAPESWMGRAELSTEGDLVFLAGAVNFQGPGPTESADYPSDGDLGRNASNGSGGISFGTRASDKKLEGVRTGVREAVMPLVRDLRDTIQRTRFHQEVLDPLPGRLDALWEHGTPIDGGGRPIEAFDARRAVVLDYWATRLDTPEGDSVSDIVEAWLRNVVQLSDHPVTDDEKAAAEARRVDGRSLRL